MIAALPILHPHKQLKFDHSHPCRRIADRRTTHAWSAARLPCPPAQNPPVHRTCSRQHWLICNSVRTGSCCRAHRDAAHDSLCALQCRSTCADNAYRSVQEAGEFAGDSQDGRDPPCAPSGSGTSACLASSSAPHHTASAPSSPSSCHFTCKIKGTSLKGHAAWGQFAERRSGACRSKRLSLQVEQNPHLNTLPCSKVVRHSLVRVRDNICRCVRAGLWRFPRL